MGIKSTLITTFFDTAKSSHNCQGNKSHRIPKGAKRLNVKEGRGWARYCMPCAKVILHRDAEKLAVRVHELD
jgi:hypothetical protein